MLVLNLGLLLFSTHDFLWLRGYKDKAGLWYNGNKVTFEADIGKHSTYSHVDIKMDASPKVSKGVWVKICSQVHIIFIPISTGMPLAKCHFLMILRVLNEVHVYNITRFREHATFSLAIQQSLPKHTYTLYRNGYIM